MNQNAIAGIALAVALVVAGVCGVVVFNKREAVARAEAAKAESRASAEKFAARKAQSDENAEAQRAAAAKERRMAAEADAAKARAEADLQREAARKAEADATIQKELRAKADAEAARMEAERESKKQEADIVRADADRKRYEANMEIARAMEADRLAKKKCAEADALANQVKLFEYAKLDLQRVAEELNERLAAVEEREAALRPEKTISDFVSKEDMVFDSNGVARVVQKLPRLPENDKSIPVESRELAKATRLLSEARAEREKAARSEFVKRMERLYEEAVKADRVVDAQYYGRVIRSCYPDWKFGETQRNKEKEKKEEGKK